MKRAFLSWLLPVLAAMASSASAQLAPDAGPWGEASDGLQLNLSVGPNSGNLLESRGVLYLSVALRNVSDRPAYVATTGGDTPYDYEYEFDGTWYAFDPLPPLRTTLMGLRNNPAMREIGQAIAPGSRRQTILTVPLAGRSPGLQLRAIAASGAGKRFEPKPGPHVVRVRPGRALESGRRAPISNALAIDFRLPANLDTSSQQITFTPASETPLRALSMTRASAADQALIRTVLDRPPFPGGAWQLITAAAINVMDPLPWYELRLSAGRAALGPGLPAPTNRRYYLLLAEEQAAGVIGVDSFSSGPLFSSTGLTQFNAAPLFRALRQLAGMERVRGAGYEPRLVQVYNVRGASLLSVLWLHSAAGRPDLFYRPRTEEFRGRTKLEADRIYLLDEFMQAAQALPVEPRHDGAWAIATAIACVNAAPEKYREFPGQTLNTNQARVEIGVSDQQDHVVWYVFIPGTLPPGVAIQKPAPGTEVLVDEADGSCRVVMRE